MKKKKMGLALIGSILLNVFFLGIIVSLLWMHPHPQFSPPPLPPENGLLLNFEQAADALSDNDRAVIMSIIEKNKSALRQHADVLGHDVQEAHRLLTAPSLDEESLKEIHDSIDYHGGAVKKGLSNMIYDIAVALPDNARVEFFQKALLRIPPEKMPPH